ncbi:MAG: TlpA family protein disulfide reductase [Planctomycetaceae bacterium]
MSERIPQIAFAAGLLAVLAATVSGCGEAPKSPPAPKTGDVARAEAPKTSPAPAAATLESKKTLTVVDPAGLEKEVHQFSGKVVLVDFWSTTCIPCIHGLPKMAELKRKLGDKGLVVLTIAMDDKQEEESDEAFQNRLLSALGNSRNDFTNLLSKLGGEEEAMNAFDVDGGALPHYRLFGRDGKLIRKFVSGDPDAVWDYTDVIQAVEAAVGK